MRRRLAVIVLLAASVSGCGTGSSIDEGDPVTETASGLPAPLSLSDDPYVVRDRLMESIASVGGVRVTVTGGPAPTTIDMVRDGKRNRYARRFSWQVDGATHEVLELKTRRVCMNLAAARELEGAGNNVMGAITGSDRPYSCTDRGDSSVSGFVMFGNTLRDPVTRLSLLSGEPSVDDVGEETLEDGVETRHVRLSAVETGSSLNQVPTTFDLWVDGAFRLVRAEFTNVSDPAESYVATLDYSEVPTVTAPADYGRLGFAPGSGIPGMGGLLASRR